MMELKRSFYLNCLLFCILMSNGGKMKKFLMCGVFMFVLCTGSYAQSASGKQEYNQIDGVERDLTLLQREMYKTPQSISSDEYIVSEDFQPNVQAGSLEHLYLKIADLEQTIATLTAQVEELSHELSQTRKEVKKINADMDVRFAETEKKLDAKKATPAPTQKAEPKQKPAVENKTSAKADYDAAYKLLDEQKYAQAQVAFEDFLVKYPQDTLSGNAQYWLGETFYVRQLYEPAAVAFAKGVKTYKDSAKGPDCLFKLGLTMEKLNKTKEACTAFKNMKKEFPKASDKLLTRSSKEIEKLGCNK